MLGLRAEPPEATSFPHQLPASQRKGRHQEIQAWFLFPLTASSLRPDFPKYILSCSPGAGLCPRDPSLEGGGEPPGSWGEDRSVPGSHDPSPCPALSTGSRVAQMLSGSRWEVSGALSIAVSAGPARASGPRPPASEPGAAAGVDGGQLTAGRSRPR